jgi:hypothetical protein
MLWAVATSAGPPIVYGRFRPMAGELLKGTDKQSDSAWERGLVCRRGAQVTRKMSQEVGALERREDQQSVRCRKTCDRGAKVTEILGTDCSTLRLACSEGIRLVDLTGGYCWRTPINGISIT